MTTHTSPAIPPRPTRSPLDKGTATDLPNMPPRPNRRIERSMSPLRNSYYAPSPLNEPPNGGSLSRTVSNDLPSRPPSVTIPSLGEEGIEYQDLDVGNASDSNHPAPAETRNVASDLKLHAPRPSLPTSSAKAKVQAVTRTDPSQAVGAGFSTIGSPVQDDQPERPTRSIYSTQGSRAASSTASFERPRSIHDEEHGIPEIGQRVPMLAFAGDVQAPSPNPYLEQPSQRSGRNHNRTRSGRESSLPPGSYGLHGHGVSNDKFEKAWYEKHPDEYVNEQGHYGSGVGTPRPDWALSSDDLNKIVRGSAVTGSGLGTSPAVTGTPEEEVGYIASDEYSHRLASPPPESKRDARPVIESPLRTAAIPAIEVRDQDKEKPAFIHIDEPYHHLHHPDGFAHTPDPEEFAHKGIADEDEEGPILAADEVRPESAYQHPAVSPTFNRRESMDYEGRSQTPSVNESRSNSRNASRRGSAPVLARYNSRDEEIHAPLEDVEEYEPLFPEDETKENEPLSTADRFKKRPDMLKHRFPSQDIWEDSPNSHQLHATVSTPDIPKEDRFETPEQEAARKSQEPTIDSHQVSQRILNNSEEQVPTRPGVAKQRFPSRDIWEDVPESQTLVTTIEPSDEKQPTSPDVPSKPTILSRPEKRQPPQVNAATKPTSPIEKRQPPLIPDRPKPQIPTRPAHRASRENDEEAQDASIKQKPIVPARPGGAKIASLKAGFLSDLNSRLQLGPQAPPKPQEKQEEAPAEKAPLSDARKGRARGPARRKPAVDAPSVRLPTIPEIKITETWNVWQVREDGNLVVGDGNKGAQASTTALESSGSNDTMAPPLARNITGESVDPQRQPHKEEDVLESQSTETDTEAAKSEPIKEESPSAVSTTELADSPVDLSSAVSDNIDNVAESLPATADGKRASNGEVSD
ncbi:altered inheritance of mitochondria protein 21 [Aspergillus cavernicola]|uniref:Altered inheritance of mitochondria protein 21 n=1 Tax=Aspergillus cavernicola TaxID=176166 RepID=A0ABR4IH19_9EURO